MPLASRIDWQLAVEVVAPDQVAVNELRIIDDPAAHVVLLIQRRVLDARVRAFSSAISSIHCSRMCGFSYVDQRCPLKPCFSHRPIPASRRGPLAKQRRPGGAGSKASAEGLDVFHHRSHVVVIGFPGMGLGGVLGGAVRSHCVEPNTVRRVRLVLGDKAHQLIQSL